jgi:asparagine synthase (glutamine-hydrolysing)
LFLFFFRGDERRYEAFETLLLRHAAWLDLHVEQVRHGLPGNGVGVFVWLRARETPIRPWHREGGGAVLASASFAPREPRAGDDGADPLEFSTDTPAVLRLDLGTGSLTADVPLIAPDPLYWAEDRRGLVVAGDLRPLLRWSGGEKNPVGVASLLQYGTIPPPHTLALGVHRLPCGHRLTSVVGEGTTVGRRVPPVSEWTRPVDTDAVIGETQRHLDAVLAEVPSRSVLFFSGGTDSGLMAARLAGIGRHDVRLVNYAFGASDEDSAHAERMAAHLKLPFRRVVYDTSRIASVFERIGADSSTPFNDQSVIPSHLMIEASRDELSQGHAAILGVGADDVYEGGLKIGDWRRVLASPAWTWGIGRRTLLARHEFGPLVMHNDLAGIGYPRDAASQDAIENAWRESIDSFSVGLDDTDRLSLMYLMNGGMGWEAPKFDVLRRIGVRAFYPFLDGPMLQHGLSLTWRQKCEGRKDKVLLKRLLERSVPPEMALRPKRGFSPPFREMLAIEPIRNLLRETLGAAGGPLEGSYDSRFLIEALDRAARGAPLNRSVTNLLWTVFFTTRWLQQVDRALA